MSCLLSGDLNLLGFNLDASQWNLISVAKAMQVTTIINRNGKSTACNQQSLQIWCELIFMPCKEKRHETIDRAWSYSYVDIIHYTILSQHSWISIFLLFSCFTALAETLFFTLMHLWILVCLWLVHFTTFFCFNVSLIGAFCCMELN